MSARLVAGRSAVLFGSNVTIADPAICSFAAFDSDRAHIYQVWHVLERDWRDELDRSGSAMEYACRVSARFRDGSILHISAWADCCDGSGCRHCRA